LILLTVVSKESLETGNDLECSENVSIFQTQLQHAAASHAII